MVMIDPTPMTEITPGLLSAIDHYCERTSDAWHAEPFNALSNLAFLVSGWAAWLLLRRCGAVAHNPLQRAVVAMIPIVGLGSLIFHILATRWAEWLDVIPIATFATLYLWVAMDRLLGCGLWSRVAALSALVVTTYLLEAKVPGSVLWGGAMYLPILIALFAIALAAARALPGARDGLFGAVLLFSAALAMRTLDQPLCDRLPLGTHFLWHLFNAATLYVLARVTIVCARPSPRRRRTRRARVPGHSRCASGSDPSVTGSPTDWTR